MKLLNVILASMLAFALGGCAHPIVIAPNTAKIERAVDATPRIKANVGFYISDESTNREVTTAGGGGDNTRYFPYRDIETAYQKMLFNVFENVTKLKAPTDSTAIGKDNIKFVISPDIITTSGSTSFLTWPPTNFTVDLTSNVRDASGKLIASPRVVGNGQAEFSDFKSDHGLAGKLAMEDALLKMQRALLETTYPGTLPAFTPATPGPASRQTPTADRLEKLKSLRDQGLITPEDFEKKKKEILDSL